jgi:phosphoesterase RecJ-like protein
MKNADDFQQAVELIMKSRNILITTHTKPDGDACGSVIAMCDALRALGKNVKPLLLSPAPEWYEFLLAGNVALLGKDIGLDELTAGRLGQFDLIVIVDTNSYSQLPKFDEYLKQADTPVLVIDHHVTADGLGDVELADSDAAAAALIVFDLLKYADWPITDKIAEALFVAVATDTGWFQFSNTDSRVHRTCAELIDAGAKPTQIYENLYHNCRYATMHVTQRDFQQTDATYSDTENLINQAHRIGTVKASALFIELKDGRIRCSLRSRGPLDVSQIAAKFGGGGHKMAAGTYLPGPLENAKQLIRTEIEKRFQSV